MERDVGAVLKMMRILAEAGSIGAMEDAGDKS